MAVGGFLVGGDVLLVQRRIMRRRIDASGDDAQQRVARARQVVIVDDVARPDQPDAGLVEFAFGELPANGPACPEGTNTNSVSGLRSRARCRNGAKSGLASGTLRVSSTSPPPFLNFCSNTLPLRCPAPNPTAPNRLLAAVLDRPVGDDAGLLAEREARAHVLGRALGHDRGARHHDDGRHFCLGGDRRHRHGARRQAGAEDIHLVVDNEFLREPFGIVGNAGIVLDDERRSSCR